MLVNNAGFGATAPLLKSDINRMEDMMTLNVVAPMRLAYAAVLGFVARGVGTVINIASTVAISPEELNGVYGDNDPNARRCGVDDWLEQKLVTCGRRNREQSP